MKRRNVKLRATVKGKRLSAAYSEGRLPRSGLPDYVQEDSHSCGFLACLTVVHKFWPSVSAMDVLRVVQPHVGGGVDTRCMVRSLAHFNISSEYRERLGAIRIQRCINAGQCVIVTVWPWDWYCDHWTVVRSCIGKVVLCNHGPTRGMSWEAFSEEWEPHGGAVVCWR